MNKKVISYDPRNIIFSLYLFKFKNSFITIAYPGDKEKCKRKKKQDKKLSLVNMTKNFLLRTEKHPLFFRISFIYLKHLLVEILASFRFLLSMYITLPNSIERNFFASC